MTDIRNINFTQLVSSTGDRLKNNFQSAWNYTGFSVADVIAIVFILIVFFWIVNVKIEFTDLDGQNESAQWKQLTNTFSGLYEAKPLTNEETSEQTRNKGPLITQVPFPKKEYAWWNFLQVDFN